MIRDMILKEVIAATIKRSELDCCMWVDDAIEQLASEIMESLDHVEGLIDPVVDYVRFQREQADPADKPTPQALIHEQEMLAKKINKAPQSVSEPLKPMWPSWTT
jgi:hypothetical protein